MKSTIDIVNVVASAKLAEALDLPKIEAELEGADCTFCIMQCSGRKRTVSPTSRLLPRLTTPSKAAPAAGAPAPPDAPWRFPDRT